MDISNELKKYKDLEKEYESITVELYNKCLKNTPENKIVEFNKEEQIFCQIGLPDKPRTIKVTKITFLENDFELDYFEFLGEQQDEPKKEKMSINELTTEYAAKCLLALSKKL